MAVYIRKEVFMKELQASHNLGRCSEGLGKLFLQIGKGLTSKKKYKNPEDREDCIAAAALQCIQVGDRFDMTRPACNPFAFFSEVSKRAILNQFNSLTKKTRDHKHYSIENLPMEI